MPGVNIASTMATEIMAPTSLHYCNSSLGDSTVDFAQSTLDVPKSTMHLSSPPPNPPFIFPGRPALPPASQSAPKSTHRRPQSAITIHDYVPRSSTTSDGTLNRPAAALPDFSFNPGAAASSPTSKLDQLLSPPVSPQSPKHSPIGAGHRRGVSEFVGGNYRSGKAQMGMPNPGTAQANDTNNSSQHLSVGPRRGHAHRRSAALSSHDISNIMRPTAGGSMSPRGNSAPSSPSTAEMNQAFSFPLSDTALPQLATDDVPVSDLLQLDDDKPDKVSLAHMSSESSTDPEIIKSPPKARVGFSDRLEFIPRPVSLVSSEASSCPTIRPGHSLSGSFSSLISISNSIVEEPDETSMMREPSSPRSIFESRPNTANGLLERTASTKLDDLNTASPRRRGSLPLLLADGPAPETLPSSPLSPILPTPKRWSFFGLESFPSSPTKSRFAHDCPPDASADVEVTSSSEQIAEHTGPTSSAQNPLPKAVIKKAKTKQMKARIWSRSILSGRSRSRSGKNKRLSRRTPTPPLLQRALEPPSQIGEASSSPSDASLTAEIADDEVAMGRATAWQLPRSVSADDVIYPMIDLDAALGPFNTPLTHNSEWESAQKASGLAKRQLHSAAGMTRFSGPGGHYVHQRAQSSPEMAPFEARRAIHRFNSSSTMADVFEEDEEDDEEAVISEDGLANRVSERDGQHEKSGAVSDLSITAPAIAPIERHSVAPLPTDSSRGLKRRGSDLEHEHPWHHTASVKSEVSSSSLRNESGLGSSMSQEFQPAFYDCNVEEEHVSQPSSPLMTSKGKKLGPVEVGPLHVAASHHLPISPYSTSASSSYPSPRSAMSDAHILSTAPSSVADDNYCSLLDGEPGPEVRCSIDQRTPSLMSSTSTMTRDSIPTVPFALLTAPSDSAERPKSLASTSFNNRRASLISLKRLINSSHGERSKLSSEVVFRSENPEQPKTSRTKRLSRLVQFWRPRDGDES